MIVTVGNEAAPAVTGRIEGAAASGESDGQAEMSVSQARSGSRRMINLECARGIASGIVVLHHFCLAFYPAIKDDFGHGGLKDTPLYVLINGTGSVTFFFALSGFVLTYGLFSRPSLPILAASTLKRLPRLMVPAGASILLGYIILQYGDASYKAAAAFSTSKWLGSFANAFGSDPFEPNIMDALRQCLFVFLEPDQYYYNSNLWTMVYEFKGSLIVFGIVLFYLISWFRGPVIMISIHLALIIIFAWTNEVYVAFVVGSLLAYLAAVTARGRAFRLPNWLSWLLVIGAVIGFSSEGWLGNTLGSLAVLLVLIGHHALAARLSGSVGALLGRLSFPLYLVHTLVILSVSSFVFARLSANGSPPILIGVATLATTLVVALLASVPFAILDTAWVSWLNGRIRLLFGAR